MVWLLATQKKEQLLPTLMSEAGREERGKGERRDRRRGVWEREERSVGMGWEEREKGERRGGV